MVLDGVSCWFQTSRQERSGVIAIPRDCSAGRLNAAAEAASKEVVKRGKEVNNMMSHEARVSCTFFLSDRKREYISVE